MAYDPELLAEVHGDLLRSFCGVGNPFSLAPIDHGSSVLDIGCGGGFDLYVAVRLVGEHGRVCGIDLTDAMAGLARKNLVTAGVTNFEIRHVESEDIPYPDCTFDAVISNGVFNLSPCKQTLFKEVFRVLKPGGSLQFADVVLESALPAAMAGSAEAWSQ